MILLKKQLLGLFMFASTLAVITAACGGGGDSAKMLPAGQTPTAETKRQVTLGLAVSDLAVGPNRFSFGLLDEDARPLTSGTVHLRFFYVTGDQGELRTEADAVFGGQGLENIEIQTFRGIWRTTGPVTFNEAGQWGVEAQVDRPDREQAITRAVFDVRQASITPAIGAPAPASQNKTLRDARLEDLTTDATPDPELYQVSIAEAIQQKKTFLVVFATPAFCQTRTCGPLVDVEKQLKAKYKSRMNFIHIEIFDDPKGLLAGGSNRTVRPAVQEWRLPSEPWVFLVDSQGRVFDKFEGFVEFSVLDEAVQRLLAAQ